MNSHNKTFTCSILRHFGVLMGSVMLALSLSTSSWAGNNNEGANAKQRYQTANIVDFATGVPVGGAATLTRTKNSATARIHTSGLETNAAYSIWWVVWNKPTLCVGGCGEDDIGIEGNGVFHAGGLITGEDGTANTIVFVNAGKPTEGAEVLLGSWLQKGRGFKSELHLVIRSHGPIIPGMVDVQVGSFNGACDVNNCFDHQAAVFTP